MHLLGRWLRSLARGEAAEPLHWQGSARETSGTKLARSLLATRGRSTFSEQIDHWLAINYWTPSLFALLTERCGEASLTLSASEVGSILSGSRLELMPRHFRAFAAVERLIRTEAVSEPACDQDLITCFATSICVDDDALRPSWWFAVYVGEEWALHKLRVQTSSPVHEMGTLRRLLPPLLRHAMAANGLDPVAHLKSCAQRLPRVSALKSHRFVDWILDHDHLEERELRLAIAFAMVLLSELGMGCRSLPEVAAMAEGVETGGPPGRQPALPRR